MRVLICLLLVSSCVLANKNDNRRNKLPFVADAVGNTLPPPSSGPATVGSPVNLLTPDRYEFYTFDESGELVKRLMTLEEIQAIVAAGEETEGLVTFANDNQPTVAFNVNPPPYTKVHSVVANVQNVLKAQMEAHKNKPPMQPTFDTPDVSDSWSLILPSIFGNTGVDIIPDKTSGAVTTPDTVTFEEQAEEETNSFIKGEDKEVLGTTKTNEEESVLVAADKAHDKTTESSTKTSAVFTPIGTTTTTSKPTTTTKAISVTTKKPATLTTKSTIRYTQTKAPVSSTTKSTTRLTQTKTTETQTTANPTTIKPFIKTTNIITTPNTETATKKYVLSITSSVGNEKNKVDIRPNSYTISSTNKDGIEFEKISTFIPVSTVTYVTERTTHKPIYSTKPTRLIPSTTKRSVITTISHITSPATQTTTTKTLATTTKKPVSSTSVLVTLKDREEEKLNLTTITTQSVSPSTTVSSTEFLTFDKINLPNDVDNRPAVDDAQNSEKYDEPLPLFDVAQSISQIASDLGGSYQPIPTTSNLLDTTNVNLLDLESKENIDIDIPVGVSNETDIKLKENSPQYNDNFIKISTIDPHNKHEQEKAQETLTFENDIDLYKQQEVQNDKTNIIFDTVQKVEITSAATSSESTTIDPILFESMGDLMSQVVHEASSIIDTEINNEDGLVTATTEKIIATTAIESLKDIKTTTELSTKPDIDTFSSNEKLLNVTVESETKKENITNVENLKESNEQPEAADHVTDAINKINNTFVNKTANINDQIFTQTLVLDDVKNESKVEVINNKHDISKNDLHNLIAEIKEKATQKPETSAIKEVIKEEVDVLKLDSKDTTSTQITTILPNVNVTETSFIIQKYNHSQFSKLNSQNAVNSTTKKDKLPELLPKVDDFKKKIQKVNIDEEELISQRNNTWKLIPTLSPPKANEIPKDKVKSDNSCNTDVSYNKDIVLEFSNENQGLEVTTKYLEEDVASFTELSNELAFRYWNVIIDDMDKRRSFVFSPYSTFSMLAMIFMGARGATSDEMNEILKLDDMVTFNPHFTLKNISDSIETSVQSGVAVSAFIRELYSDRNKGKILTFYKERAQHFYNGHVEEVNFKLISDIIRRRTNLLVKRYTWGKIPEYMKTNNIVMQPPLAAFTTNIFQTDCTGTSVDGRDGEMYFVVSPNVRQRRLVPVPAVVYKKGFLAGYDPVLDVTVAALGNTNTIISTLFLMPGQQGNVVHADDLEKLEQRLLEALPTTPTWNRVLRTLLPRTGLELQIPRFSHKSTFNTSSTLKKMGLKDIFNGEHADLGGLTGPSKELYLSDMIQLNNFVTCGEGVIGEQHHIEEYPENVGAGQRRRARWLNDWDEPRDYQRAFHDPHDISDAMHLPLHLRPRQARLPARSTQAARLKFDRPFLYFVRHNPSGMILYFGRYNPRLLP